MLKAETFKNLILTMGTVHKVEDCGDVIVSKVYSMALPERSERLKWLHKFEDMEKAGHIHSNGDNVTYRDTCALWTGNRGTGYNRLIISLFSDRLTMQWVTKFSYEK